MKIKKILVSNLILLLALLSVFQFLGYTSRFTRYAVVAIPNEATAIAQARTRLRSWDIPVEGYIFAGEFSLRTWNWIVTVSPEDNVSEITHVIRLTPLRGWSWGEDIHEDYWRVL